MASPFTNLITFIPDTTIRSADTNFNFAQISNGFFEISKQWEEVRGKIETLLGLEDKVNEISDKLDNSTPTLDLDNISDAARLVITNLITPDYSKRKSMAVTTAGQSTPDVGWLYVNLIGGGGGGSPSSTITINGQSFYQNVTVGYGGGSPTMYFVGKGTVFSSNIPRPSVAQIYFIPCVGAASKGV